MPMILLTFQVHVATESLAISFDTMIPRPIDKKKNPQSMMSTLDSHGLFILWLPSKL